MKDPEGDVRRARVSSTVEVRPPHDTLVSALEAAAAGDAPFFTFHGAKGATSRTSAEALGAARRWGALLRARGVTRGDRIPILLPTGHSFVEAMLGAMTIGAIPVPLAVPMTFGGVERYVHNLSSIVADADARVLVTYPRIRDAVAKEDRLRDLVRDVVIEADLDGLGPLGAPAPSLSSSDPAFLQYTSGTTGKPKGAIISHGALVANAFAIAHGLDIRHDDVGVSWLPLFHDMGLIGVLLTSICHPYPVHVMSPESFVMNPRRWLELLARVGGTLSAAPNFAYELCSTRAGDLEGARLDTWRVGLNGAEPVHKATADRFTARFADAGLRGDVMLPVYGMAEATLAITFPRLTERLETFAVDRASLERHGRAIGASAHAHDAVSVGRPVAGTSVEIVGDAGVVAERVVGEIRVRSASLMDGYFRNDDASAEAISGGWLRTGDLGFVDAGRLFVTGRAKDLIIKGGRNYYPYDVERVASEVAGVRAGGVAAFGRPNAETGTDDLVVVAESVHSDGERRAAIAKEVRAELLSVLGVKADDVIVCATGAVPRTTSGKIRRRDCAQLFGAGV